MLRAPSAICSENQQVIWGQRLAAGSGAATVVVGLAHIALSLSGGGGWSLDRLWFAGSGLAVVLIGGLTLLAASARAWQALRVAALGANVAGFVLALGFGVLTDWRQPQGPLLLLLFAAGGAGSVRSARGVG